MHLPRRLLTRKLISDVDVPGVALFAKCLPTWEGLAAFLKDVQVLVGLKREEVPELRHNCQEQPPRCFHQVHLTY